MARKTPTCVLCNLTFHGRHSREDRRRHMLLQHHNNCTLRFWRWDYQVTIYRASDVNYHCPFQGCDYSESDRPVFERHFGGANSSSHQAYKGRRCFKAEVKENVGPTYEVRTNPRKTIPSPIPTTTKASSTRSSSANTIRSSESQRPLATTSPTNKRKAESTKSEEMRATLRAEYMKRLHEEMLETLGDRSVDLKESAKKQEELKDWFENGMRMLREAELVDL
ncbi:hypothetical protein BJ508DRAFT_334061 [Ascobolus immersus RN42]|uniref:Uncharacterized protein n=1 Tax=Ascobolus immersus RN42 TaxID=1160509 RepID=A0A3N4HHH3_ASCIM|nr:hypothetical protein BJ508DRAFT_334061 [Ascobolus immersus RN42]